ncbi:peroxiredoxin C [Buchnera aphidicola]|uniref:peroxiredoxin C n=1 Tax=Buchnera aphidicola TaxID=9 RepID=UPI003464637C
MVLVTQKAPDFTAPAILHNGKIIENFNFKKYTSNKATILFFWPMDFTFVCPSEIIAFNQFYEEFKQRDVKIVGVSFDSVFVHNAWRNTPINKGGIGEIKYTMVSDLTRNIQKTYDIEHPHLGMALRASFLINKNGIICHQVINDLPFGRNIKEMLRMVDAMQFHEKNGSVCPAQWEKGQDSMEASPSGVSKYLSKNRNYLS